MLADAAQHVVYLAGVSGDGTNNGALTTMANKALGAASVVNVIGFAVKASLEFFKGKGAEGHKSLIHTAGLFAFVEGCIFAAWGLARIGIQVFGGAVG